MTNKERITSHNELIDEAIEKVDALPDAGPDVSGVTATASVVRSGYKFVDSSGELITGSLADATQATPSITVSSSGLITASATQSAGYVASGTKSATKQLTTKGATTVTPSSSVQTVVNAGTYCTGAIKVAAVSGGGKTIYRGSIEPSSYASSLNVNTGYTLSSADTFIIFLVGTKYEEVVNGTIFSYLEKTPSAASSTFLNLYTDGDENNPAIQTITDGATVAFSGTTVKMTNLSYGVIPQKYNWILIKS